MTQQHLMLELGAATSAATVVIMCGTPDVYEHFNSLTPRQDGRHFTDDIVQLIFFNENCCLFIQTSLKYVLTGPNQNKPVLNQIKAWRRTGDKSLSESVLPQFFYASFSPLGLG